LKIKLHHKKLKTLALRSAKLASIINSEFVRSADASCN